MIGARPGLARTAKADLLKGMGVGLGGPSKLHFMAPFLRRNAVAPPQECLTNQ